jgi:hypothetical protein
MPSAHRPNINAGSRRPLTRPIPCSTGMLGALPPMGGGGGGGGDGSSPMRGWSLWWILRTYLQSLGQVTCQSSLCCSRSPVQIYAFLW